MAEWLYKKKSDLRQWLARFFLWLAMRLQHFTHLCANRIEYEFHFRHHTVRVIVRDLREPDGYSREEIYEMMRTVRQEEKRMDWKCPEPDPDLTLESVVYLLFTTTATFLAVPGLHGGNHNIDWSLYDKLGVIDVAAFAGETLQRPSGEEESRG